MVAHFTTILFKYFMVIWFIGVALVPLINLASSGQYHLDVNVFVIPLCVGYFVLGAYLVNIKIQRKTLVTLTTLGVSLTFIATYFMSKYVGGANSYFFQDYSSITIILASIPLFILLNSYTTTTNTKPQPLAQKEKPSKKQYILQTISKNSLAIFLLHMMILYTLQNGFLSTTFNNYITNAIIGIPIKTALALILSLTIIIPLKKIQYLKKLIG
jgi:surface polysaccharide O-acyltransferase-like enzyme